MKLQRILITLIAITAIAYGVFAQPMTMVTYETKLALADEAAKKNDYYNAIEWFEKAFEESKDLWLQVAIADLYALARDYNRSVKIYERILKRDKKGEFEEIRVDYARVLKSLGRYQEAADEFRKVIEKSENDSITNIANFELDGIRLLKTIPQNIEVVVDFASDKINSPSAESSPSIYPDGSLFYSSFNRKDAVILGGGDADDYHAKLYSTTKKDQDWEKPKAVNDLVNREGFNAGGVSFNRDGSRMYYTLTDLEGNKVKGSKLFYAELRNDKWTNPTEIESLNGEFNNVHPVVGELYGRDVLFFASDMPGGQGGFDIYYADIIGKGFGLAVNLGEAINTAGDEVSPFYKDGILYFSSNGHPTIGGFDIYSAKWTGSAWEEVKNMGLNYNSSYDDLFIRINRTGSAGFLVSNRIHKNKKKIKGSETCCDDIYEISLRDKIIDLLVDVENKTGPMEGATVELYDLTIGGAPDIKTSFESNNIQMLLNPDRRYKAYIKKDGYHTDSLEFNTMGIRDDYSIKRKVTMNEKPEDETELVYINQPIKLNNIYYDLDDDKILPDAEDDLGYLLELMENYPDMVIELSSHTDSRGSDDYNLKLSQRRADSAKRWLVNNGISPERIKPVGYGETRLLNRCKNNIKCSEAEHRLNRRTEFKIIAGPQTIQIKKEVFKERRVQ